jgi:hypothetical protein
MSDDTFAIGTLTQCQNLCDDAWDLLRTARPRLTDPSAQRAADGGPPKVVCVATSIAVPEQHPTVLTRYAVLVNRSLDDADIRAAVKWWADRPAALALLLAGPTITLTFPDGTTATRPNHFWQGTQAATQTKWLRLLRIVLPDPWSNVTAYAVGDTCWRAIGAQNVPIGFRCLVAHTGSAPTMANANWSAYLGPKPAGWDRVPEFP